MTIRTNIYSFIDRFARKCPPALLRPFAMPINYHNSSKDSVIYESARMLSLAFAYCMNNKISGNYAEFGVFQGRAFSEAWKSAHQCGMSEMHFWAFDSFQGLPEISGKDLGGPFEKGEFSSSRETFKATLQRYNFDLSRLHIIEGFYDATLIPSNEKAERLKDVSIAWIDCDLYESTVPVLNYLTDRLVNGAVLIFDDWYCFDGGGRAGEQLACSEWLASNPQIKLIEYQNFHWAGKAFIFNRF